MPQFKRVVKRIFRVSRKSRKPLPPVPQDSEVHDAAESLSFVPPVYGIADAADSEATQSKFNLQYKQELATSQVVPQPQCSTETIATGVEGDYGEEDIEEDESEDEEDVSETVPSELAVKTSFEMMINHLYVALSDDDHEIAALRTDEGKKFTHIVRMVFTPSTTDANVKPSQWSTEQFSPVENGVHELRLTCPDFALRFDDDYTSLKGKQLLAARDYIAAVLPRWDREATEFEHSIRASKGQVLIVGPSGRFSDVLTIFLCYITFLTGVNGKLLLGRFRQKAFVCPTWRHQVLGNASYELAENVAKVNKS